MPLLGGGTGIGAVGAVIWLPTRPAAEHISGASAVTITASAAFPVRQLATVTITDPKQIAALSHTIALLGSKAGGGGCVVDDGFRLTAIFTGPRPPTVVVTVNPACFGASLVTGGVSEPPLQEGGLSDQEARLLGTSLPALQQRASSR